MPQVRCFFFFWISLSMSFVTRGQEALIQVNKSLELLKRSELVEARKELSILETIPIEDLTEQLADPTQAKAFWVNYYNTIVQLVLTEDPQLYGDKGSFFSTERVLLAGQKLSLDDIEHGIIRGSKHKYTLGYTEKVFVNDFEETFRLPELDYRVHFALNCGAVSCPPVVIYETNKLDRQLDQSTLRYLQREVRYDRDKDEILIPKLGQWFHADFGGDSGIRKMLSKYLPELNISNKTNISYLAYDWTLKTGDFIDLESNGN